MRSEEINNLEKELKKVTAKSDKLFHKLMDEKLSDKKRKKLKEKYQELCEEMERIESDIEITIYG